MNNLENTTIRIATSEESIRSCYKFMHQLRPHLTSEQTFINQVECQIRGGYRLAYIRLLSKLNF